MNGFDRPWHSGMLWNKDPRIANALKERLEAHGCHVGDNEPYSGQDLFHTMNIPGLSMIREETLREINRAVSWLIANSTHHRVIFIPAGPWRPAVTDKPAYERFVCEKMRSLWQLPTPGVIFITAGPWRPATSQEW